MHSRADMSVASPPSSPCLWRQRSLTSVISCHCCSKFCVGQSSSVDHDFDLFHPLPPHEVNIGGFFSLQRASKKQAISIWQESTSRLLGNGRLKVSSRGIIFCNGVASLEVDEADEVHCKPSPWKLLMRKIRAETKKMNCARPSPPGFHYDALSYSMNFDDGGWQPPRHDF